jgi:hypothetical protein
MSWLGVLIISGYLNAVEHSEYNQTTTSVQIGPLEYLVNYTTKIFVELLVIV